MCLQFSPINSRLVAFEGSTYTRIFIITTTIIEQECVLCYDRRLLLSYYNYFSCSITRTNKRLWKQRKCDRIMKLHVYISIHYITWILNSQNLNDILYLPISYFTSVYFTMLGNNRIHIFAHSEPTLIL